MEPQEAQLFVHTGVYAPERAAALRQAAAEGAGAVAVSILDPSNPEEAGRYALASAQCEAAKHASEENYSHPDGIPGMPRTPEEIQVQVVAPALRAGKVLVLIETSRGGLGGLWKRVDEIAPFSDK